MKTIANPTQVIDGITMPVGYSSVAHYKSTCEGNLRMAKANPSKYGHLIDRYNKILDEINKSAK